MSGHLNEVLVACEHDQVMPDAKLSQQRIDGSGLNAGSPTPISQPSGLDMIIAIRHQKRNCRKSIQNLITSFRTRKALQEFLHDEARCEDCLAGFDRSDECSGLDRRIGRIATERERPDTRVNE
jgi:hypothetical protein